MQRHHRTLGKAKQHDLFGQQIFVHHQRIEKGVQVIDRLHHPAFGFFLRGIIDPGDREPLEPHGRTGTGFGRIGGHEQRVGQMFPQRVGKPQQIGTIRAIAMQEHDGRPRFPRDRFAALCV